MMIDYRELLKKYMDMVAWADGITHIHAYGPTLSEEEQKELELIEDELIADDEKLAQESR